MYTQWVTDNISNVELIVWLFTVGTFISSSLQARDQFKNSRSTAGRIKPGTTGPSFWTKLAMLGQFVGFFVPPFIYWTTTAYNGFQRSGLMKEYSLPSPPDVFGVDGVMISRVIGLLMYFAGGNFGCIALKCLGDQYSPIGIKEKPRLVDHGPFAYVRHPLYTATMISNISFALALWSYIPLYALLVTTSACLLKVPIEERTIERDPELGSKYKEYKLRVPYRVIPYIW